MTLAMISRFPWTAKQLSACHEHMVAMVQTAFKDRGYAFPTWIVVGDGWATVLGADWDTEDECVSTVQQVATKFIAKARAYTVMLPATITQINPTTGVTANERVIIIVSRDRRGKLLATRYAINDAAVPAKLLARDDWHVEKDIEALQNLWVLHDLFKGPPPSFLEAESPNHLRHDPRSLTRRETAIINQGMVTIFEAINLIRQETGAPFFGRAGASGAVLVHNDGIVSIVTAMPDEQLHAILSDILETLGEKIAK